MEDSWFVPYQGPPQGQQKPKKKQKDFWTDQISTGGGIGGALAGGAAGAALGSVVPVVGTAIGGLAGAILGGAAGSGAGELTENVVMKEEDLLKNVGQEALLGGIFSAPPIRAARGLFGAVKGASTGAAKEGFEQGFAKKGLGKLGKKAEDAGQQLLVAQANVPRGMARQLNIGETFSNLNKYGLNQLDDIADIAPRITGENGLMSSGVRKAVSKTAGVNTDGFREVAQTLVEDNGTLLQPHISKNISNEITQILKKTAGGDKGSLNPLANPLDVFDVVKSLERKGASFGRGKAVNMLSPDEQAAKTIYNGMAAELKDRLFAAPGIEQALPVIKESMAKQVEALAKETGRSGLGKLASDIRSATDINQLRKLQSPFVRGGQVAAETALSQSTSGLTFAQGAKGIGRFGNPLQAGAAVLETANAPIGSALINRGQKLSGQAALPVSPIKQATGGAMPLAARQAIGTNVFGAPNEQPMTLEEALMQEGGAAQAVPGAEQYAEQPVDQSPYSKENLLADMQRDPENADKYMEYYGMLQEVYAPAEQTELSSGQQKTAVTAQNALNDIGVLQGAIESGDIGKTMVPFSDNAVIGNMLGTNGINAALYNIGDVVLRSRTGAAAPKEEVEKFIAGYLPRAGESKETQMYKLKRAYNELMGMVNPPAALGVGSASSLEDALMSAQGGY